MASPRVFRLPCRIRPVRWPAIAFAFSILSCLFASAQAPVPVPVDLDPSVHAVAPPAPPPAIVRATPAESSSPRSAGLAAGAPHSIGEPTDEEQLYVEFINRSRAHPQAEAALFLATTDPDVLNAYRFFKVDLDLMTAQYALLGSLPPVSINARLTEAARVHSLDMYQKEFQGHTGSDGSDIGQRLNRAGYTYQTVAENVYASAKGVWHGHAGFEVDWGNGPGGMQTPPGHRNTIHNAAYREIGVGVVLGETAKVGPQLVAQEFASPFNPRPFITGVVYFDFNGNQFYDVGEGIGGVTVRVSGTSSHAVTARSGGYSVPVDGNGSATVTFQVPGLSDVTQPVTVAALANLKLDHIPPYSAPVLGGSSVAGVGIGNPYVFSPVPAATAYDWRSLRRIPWINPDGAEPGPGLFVTNTSAGYNPVATDVRRSGSASYHFAHPAPAQSQYLTLRQPLQIGAGSELSYWSRLGFATATQTARVQISVDDGRTWNDLWTQSGTGGAGETGFARRTVPLGAHAGRIVLIRFAYTSGVGNYFPQTSSGVGWYLDDILVSDAETLTDEVITPASGNTLAFLPEAEGLYVLQVRARIGDRTLPWGPDLRLTAQAGVTVPAVVRLGSLSLRGDGAWDLPFSLEQGSAAALEVESAGSVEGPWTKDAGAVIEPPGGQNTYHARIDAGGGLAVRFFRIVAR